MKKNEEIIEINYDNTKSEFEKFITEALRESNINNIYDQLLKAYDELEKEVAELRQWKETNSKIIDEQKPIIEAYNKSLETRKEELLNKMSKSNEEIKAKLANESLETLENFDSLYAHEQPPKGVSSNNAQGLNEGDGNDDGKAEQQARNDAVESMFGDLFNKEE